MDHKLTDKHGLQTEGRREKGNPKPATHPDTGIAEIDFNTSTSRLPRLTVSSRHLGETMGNHSQPKTKTELSKLPRPIWASSWQTGHSKLPRP